MTTATVTDRNVQFKPNRLTFDQGVDRMKSTLAKVGVDLAGRIFTSRDADAAKATEALVVDNVPIGFKKWQLPILMEKPSQLYITAAPADAKVPHHSHDEGDGVRVILSGSIIYNGVELTAGDWMFIPKGKPYSFTVGARGATMVYCYSCCCA